MTVQEVRDYLREMRQGDTATMDYVQGMGRLGGVASLFMIVGLFVMAYIYTSLSALYVIIFLALLLFFAPLIAHRM